ncbi:MAG: ribonuclease III [Planctomycetaceae bacterium]|nr:ribonuclease III [Planctomycetaceae bacterium]
MKSKKTFWDQFRGWFIGHKSVESPDVDGIQVSEKDLVKLAACEKTLGYRFKDAKLLKVALTHTSGASYRLASNERLEFLGDAILGQIISEWLFCEFPRYLEGELTRIKSVIVSRKTCANVAENLKLQEMVIVGKGIDTQDPIPRSILSNAFESIVAALYLDGGYEAAQAFVLNCLKEDMLAMVAEGLPINYKSLFQQVSQREFKLTPVYKLIGERGPDHQKEFHVCAVVGDSKFESGWGNSKKEAEQVAALNALMSLGEIDDESMLSVHQTLNDRKEMQ